MVTYDEAKRRENLKKHGIDFADCGRIFDAPILTDEDARLAYGEGLLNGRVVVLVWTERENGPHLISCRYGEKHESKHYFETLF
jgi:uncharacterized DUF497 family protein